jgi:hypothetical protein
MFSVVPIQKDARPCRGRTARRQRKKEREIELGVVQAQNGGDALYSTGLRISSAVIIYMNPATRIKVNT